MLQRESTLFLTLLLAVKTVSTVNTYTVQPYFPRAEVYYGHAIPPSEPFDVSYSYGRSVLLVPIVTIGIAITVSFKYLLI